MEVKLPKIDQSKLDNIHWNPATMLGYNKRKNIIISPRELGKSTNMWLYCYRKLLKGKTTMVFRYIQADITDVYIDDIANLLNKFLVNKIEFDYKKGSIKDGIVDVNVKYEDNKYPFFRVVAINLPLRRLKSLMYPNLSTMILDEFIVDTRNGEKYPRRCDFKMNEIFKTFVRESADLKMFFLGNPYSLYNWVFSWCKITPKELYPGAFVVKSDTVCEVGVLSAELKKYILDRDKDYVFDDSYTAYSFDGRSINDEHIIINEKCPDYYELVYVFFIEGKKLAVFRSGDVRIDDKYYFWIGIVDKYESQRRNLLTFDYNSLVEGAVLFDKSLKQKYQFLKYCFRNRKIMYKSIEESYLFEQIYEWI